MLVQSALLGSCGALQTRGIRGGCSVLGDCSVSVPHTGPQGFGNSQTRRAVGLEGVSTEARKLEYDRPPTPNQRKKDSQINLHPDSNFSEVYCCIMSTSPSCIKNLLNWLQVIVPALQGALAPSRLWPGCACTCILARFFLMVW